MHPIKTGRIPRDRYLRSAIGLRVSTQVNEQLLETSRILKKLFGINEMLGHSAISIRWEIQSETVEAGFMHKVKEPDIKL